MAYKMRYIVVTGGVISGIGKGITASTIGLLFQSMGHAVTMIKIDPYVNVNAGLISPYEHGECFVLSDGGESDLDLGNYERFLNIELTRNHNITTGKIYQTVIQKERTGDYLGATVQIVPHITDAIIKHITDTSIIPINGHTPDICIIEVGGTIGDIEMLPFIEALQQMKALSEDDTFCFVHVAMAINNPELKTKPIQHSVSTLRSRGIFPDILVVRATEPLTNDVKHKLHRLCQITADDIISNPNVSSIYHVAHTFYDQGVHRRLSQKLYFPIIEIKNIPYANILSYYQCIEAYPKIKIGVVGKYTKSPDTYLSIMRAIEHASFNMVNTEVELVDSENLVNVNLEQYHGFIIPGGFGSRGINGKIIIAEYARINRKPLLGICLGLHVMVVNALNHIYNQRSSSVGSQACNPTKLDSSRDFVKSQSYDQRSCYGSSSAGSQSYGSSKYATSREWDELPIPTDQIKQGSILNYVIDILPNQTGIKGGTMRLGNYETRLVPSLTRSLYGSETIVERHRHRYEVNNEYLSDLELTGLKIVGIGKTVVNTELVEMVEDPQHPFYIGCQFHPEFKSRVNKPHPLFKGLINACMKV
ncbi:CTP synthetase [uncultured virus]|nr:CTP synthetase [uncultured virus]